MSRRLADLNPETRKKIDLLLSLATAEGLRLVVVHTLRTYEEQALLYQKGRARPGPIVTNARPGYSYHNFGRAVDFAFPGKKPGSVVWKGPWERLGALAVDCGLVWGGNFKKLKDRPHVEDSIGVSLAELRANHT